MVSNDLLHPGQSRCNLPAPGSAPELESDSDCGLLGPPGFRVTVAFAVSALVPDLLRLLVLPAGEWPAGGINGRA